MNVLRILDARGPGRGKSNEARLSRLVGDDRSDKLPWLQGERDKSQLGLGECFTEKRYT